MSLNNFLTILELAHLIDCPPCETHPFPIFSDRLTTILSSHKGMFYPHRCD